MSTILNNIDDLFEMDILNSTVIEEGTLPKTGEGTPTPKLQETFPEVTIPVPGKTELTASVYNDAIAKLKNLMKESADIMQSLVDVEIVQESVETLQERFTEEAMENAIFESYINGPIFESVNNPDKKEIRKAIKAVIKAAPKYTEDDYSLRVFNTLAKDAAMTATRSVIGSSIGNLISLAVVANLGIPVPGSLLTKTAAKNIGASAVVGGAVGAVSNTSTKMYIKSLRENKDFTARLWQMVGCFNVPEDKLNTALKYYTEMYKDQIGDLVFNATKLRVGGTKQMGFCYLLILDSKKEKVETIELNIDEDKKEDKK